jgi:hypothetical protein
MFGTVGGNSRFETHEVGTVWNAVLAWAGTHG